MTEMTTENLAECLDDAAKSGPAMCSPRIAVGAAARLRAQEKEIGRLRSQLGEALDGREKKLSVTLLSEGGEWLGAARNWMQRRCLNGESVTWGSRDELRPTFTVAMVEDLAATVAAAAMGPQPTETHLANSLRARWKAEMEAERLRGAVQRAHSIAERDGGPLSRCQCADCEARR